MPSDMSKYDDVVGFLEDVKDVEIPQLLKAVQDSLSRLKSEGTLSKDSYKITDSIKKVLEDIELTVDAAEDILLFETEE